MTVREYAQLYNTSERTIKRYKAQGLPLDDPETMREKMATKRSPRGVSKLCRRLDAPITTPNRTAGVTRTPLERVSRESNGSISGSLQNAPEIDFTNVAGLSGAIERYRQAELAAARVYREYLSEARKGHPSSSLLIGFAKCNCTMQPQNAIS
jgi:hypothetical protein